MPKTNLCRSDEQQRLEQVKQNIRVAIVSQEEVRGISRRDTVLHSGMSPSNFYKAWKSPELFRVRDLHNIYEYLRVPEDNRQYV